MLTVYSLIVNISWKSHKLGHREYRAGLLLAMGGRGEGKGRRDIGREDERSFLASRKGSRETWENTPEVQRARSIKKCQCLGGIGWEVAD